MNISILSARKINEYWRIKFSSQFGAASALWFGCEPTVGASVSGELDCDQCECSAASGSVRFSLSENEDEEKVVLICKVEAITEDETMILRIGDDLLQCEYSSRQFSVGEWVKLQTSELKLHDLNY